MYVGNDSYGHRRILARAADLPADLPVRGVLQHGWTQRSLVDLPLPGLLEPRVFGWSAACSSRSLRYGLDAWANIGSPFLYWLKEPGQVAIRRNITKRGVLFIPPHSTRLTDTVFSIDGWVAEQKERYSGLDRFTVMLHPVDARKPDLVARVNAQGVGCWTNPAGLKSERFLENLLRTLSAHELVVSSNLQTAVFYAAYLGAQIELDVREQGFMTQSGEYVQDLTAELVEDLGIVDGRPWLEVSEEQLGVRELREAEELREILGWGSRRERGLSRVLGLPNAARSQLAGIVQNLRHG